MGHPCTIACMALGQPNAQRGVRVQPVNSGAQMVSTHMIVIIKMCEHGLAYLTIKDNFCLWGTLKRIIVT